MVATTGETSKPSGKSKAPAKKKPTAQAAAKKVDSVDRTEVRDETKVRPSKAATSAAKGGIRLDPNLPLVPGNAVSFVAEERPGRVQAKIITSKDSWLVAASNGGGDARVSKIIEVGGDITVEFYEDGKLYASDTWTVS